MRMIWCLCCLPIGLLAATDASAETQAPSIQVETLIQSTTDWNGTQLEYPDGTPQLTVTKITMQKGAAFPMHCHPMPLGGYMLKGRLEVKTKAGNSTVFEPNTAAIEVTDTWHYGTALEDTEILVVYAGAEGLPLTIAEDGDAELAAGCR